MSFYEQGGLRAKEPGEQKRIFLHLAVFVLAFSVLALGALVSGQLRDKIFIFGPVFILTILIVFYGFVLEPKPFAPARIHRYATRPPAVERLGALLRDSSPPDTGIRLYRTYRRVMCGRLGLPRNCSDDELASAATAFTPSLGARVRDFNDSYLAIVNGTVRVGNEKEFVEHFRSLNELVLQLGDGDRGQAERGD